MNWLMIFIGILIGWLIEWLIDVFFWRRRGQVASGVLEACQVDLDATQNEIRALQTQLERQQARAVELEGQVVALTHSDDLTLIEGIGPKIAALLNAQDIVTYAQLAETRVPQLREILRAAGERFRMADPETWPEQARLASKGEWDALHKLQDHLDGGRAPRAR